MRKSIISFVVAGLLAGASVYAAAADGTFSAQAQGQHQYF